MRKEPKSRIRMYRIGESNEWQESTAISMPRFDLLIKQMSRTTRD